MAVGYFPEQLKETCFLLRAACRDFNHNQLCKTKGFRPESFLILMVLCHEKQLALLLNLYSQRSDRKENIEKILKNQYQYHKILQSCILFIEIT